MTRLIRQFSDRAEGEPLARFLYRNADALGLTAGQKHRLHRASALTLGDEVDRADAGVIAASVRDELGASFDAVIFAAQARGEAVVDVVSDTGERLECKRVKGRDGLWSLLDSTALTEAQFNTGLVYRMLFEVVGGAVIGSQLGNVDGAGAARTSTTGLIKAGLHRAHAGIRLTAAEAVIGSQERIAVLRAVAGQGLTIGSLSTSGHRRKAMTEALAADLDLIRAPLADTGGLRITGS